MMKTTAKKKHKSGLSTAANNREKHRLLVQIIKEAKEITANGGGKAKFTGYYYNDIK